MANIAQEAESYEPATTSNIADLDKVSTKLEIETKTFKVGTPDEFSMKVVTIEGVDYRVPVAVLGDLKAILKIKPDLEFFKVTKAGSGMNTRYTTIPF